MAISLKDLKTVRQVLPPRLVIYGPPGMGKTTLASEFPDPVFLQTEDGAPNDLELSSFGLLTGFDQVMEALASLYSESHDRKTLVLDSLDKLEPLVWAATCAENKWPNIETPGYGKGYLAADTLWRDFIEGCNALRRDREMAIVLLAHSEVIRFDDPRTVSYSQFDIRLQKRAHALIQDEVDCILMVNQDPSLKEEDVGFNKKRVHAEGGTQRWIYTEGRPAWTAKNRYQMPPRLLFQKGKGFSELAKHFVGAVADAPKTEPEAAAAETKQAA